MEVQIIAVDQRRLLEEKAIDIKTPSVVNIVVIIFKLLSLIRLFLIRIRALQSI